VGHAGIGVEGGEFAGGAEVPYDEGAFVDPPQPFTLGEFGELGDFDGGEAEEPAGGLGFVEGLVVEDAGGGVAEQSLGESPGLGAGVADGVEVREAVHDHQVREPPSPGQFPLGLHPSEERRLGEEPPRFVVDHEALPAFGVCEGGLHPRGSTRHDQADEGVGAGDCREVQAEHRDRRVESDGRWPVEQPTEIASHESGEGVADFPAVGAELLDAGAGHRLSWVEEGVDDHRQDRHRRPPLGVGEGGVERRALGRTQLPPEGRFAESGEQPGASGVDLGSPGGVVDARRSWSLVERVETVGATDTELDGGAPQGAGDDGPLALAVWRSPVKG